VPAAAAAATRIDPLHIAHWSMVMVNKIKRYTCVTRRMTMTD